MTRMTFQWLNGIATAVDTELGHWNNAAWTAAAAVEGNMLSHVSAD